MAMAFAATTARALFVEPRVSITLSEDVLFAERNSLSTDTHQFNPVRTNAVRVLGFSPDGTAPVYDLTVEGAHEFFANGVLVHNCLRYIEMSNPMYVKIEPRSAGDDFTPMAGGFSY